MSGYDFRAEIRTIEMPLVAPFRTSRAVDSVREVLLLRWVGRGSEGWAECGVDPDPSYYPETVSSVRTFLKDFLLPLVFDHRVATAAEARSAMSDVPGHVLAKAAVETAVLDAELRRAGMRLRDYLGGAERAVPVGVSVGIADSIPDLVKTVTEYLAEGYRRVKIKIQPGWDVQPLRAIRAEFGDELRLQVDANQAYSMADLPVLRSLDEFGLQLLEQPFVARDLLGHAELAARVKTPICLDESINSATDAAAALRLGAASVINIKPARVGGYLEARAIHDLCLAQGIPVWCGGLLETGIGRAANLNLAALPGFTLPGDISATSRYYARDITQHFELDDAGMICLPNGFGTGADIDIDRVEAVTRDVQTVELYVR